MLKHLDLFSGLGGFSLGLEATGGFKTVGFCEIEPFCQQVLKKHWPDVPIYNDVRGLKHDGAVDIVTGGYPCQPFSTAGKRKGQSDPRHLWPAMFSLIEKHRPRWVIGENVAGHISMGLDQVLADLERSAYSTIPFVIPACAVGAPHRRDRIWIVAWDTESQRTPPQSGIQGGQDANAIGVCGNHATNPERDGQHDPAQRGSIAGCPDQGRMPEPERPCGAPADVSAYAEGERLQGQCQSGTGGGAHGGVDAGRGLAGSVDQAGDGFDWRRITEEGFWRSVEPPVCGMDDGIPYGLDSGGQPAPKTKAAMHTHRIKHLGNAVVPQIPFMLGKFILEVEKKMLTPSP